MGRSDYGAEIVRILNSVKHNQQTRSGENLLERNVSLGCRERHNSLMRHAFHHSVQSFTRLESNRNPPLPAQFDDLLKPSAGGALNDVYTVQRPAGPQGFSHRMDSSQR